MSPLPFELRGSLVVALLRNALAVLVVLSGIVGLYLGLDLVRLSWLFWLLVAGSLAAAVVRKAWPSFRTAIKQWRNYPSLASEAAAMKLRINKLKSSRDEARERAEIARLEGIAEGRAQVVGALLASAVSPPHIVAISDYDGQVSLVANSAEGSSIAVGARFQVIVSATGALRGVAQIVHFDAAIGSYFLTCVEPTSPAFWEALRDRVDIDTSPPNGVKLERSSLDPVLFDASTSNLSAATPEVTE